jgi:hypothetical protein
MSGETAFAHVEPIYKTPCAKMISEKNEIKITPPEKLVHSRRLRDGRHGPGKTHGLNALLPTSSNALR